MYIHTLYLLLFTSTVVVAVAVAAVLQLDWILIFLLRYLQDSSLDFTPPPPLLSSSRGRFETPFNSTPIQAE